MGSNSIGRTEFKSLVDTHEKKSQLPLRRKRRFISNAHLQRLQKIGSKFGRENDYNININSPQYYTDKLVPARGVVEQNADYQVKKHHDKNDLVLQRQVWLNYPRYQT